MTNEQLLYVVGELLLNGPFGWQPSPAKGEPATAAGRS